MDCFDWIMSEGGPLICVEAVLAESWGGIDRLSVSKLGAETDYDRACDGSRKTLTVAPLKNGDALFFQGPYDTSFWRRPSDDTTFVIRIEACDVDIDINSILLKLDDRHFGNPIEITNFEFRNGNLRMFDSAWNGDDPEVEYKSFNIDIGRYIINTHYFDTLKYSMYVHKFDKIF